MKRIILLAIAILALISCTKDQKNYTIEIKDGVEIIKNKNIESAPNLQLNLNLITEVSLDEMILPDSIPAMKAFSSSALDNDGNIYISDFRKSIVYKVDKKGNYLTNFHRKGQGPGEGEVIYDIQVMNDSVYVFGIYGKASIFTKSGKFVKQFRLFDSKYSKIQVFNSENNIICFCKSMIADWEKGIQKTSLGVFHLNANNMENYSKIIEINSTEDFNNYVYLANNELRQCNFSHGKIYLEDLSTTNYAIDIYDVTGKKVNRIEKQSIKIACSEEIKKKAKEMDLRNSKIKVVADYMKQILKVYVDNNINIWIKPAVKGFGRFDHQFYDIFNPRGIFLKRIQLPLPITFQSLSFDKNKLIAIDRENCIVRVYDYEFE